MTPSPDAKPRPKYLGQPDGHPLEHGNDLDDAARSDELVGTTPHLPAEDARPEEPSHETEGSTEGS